MLTAYGPDKWCEEMTIRWTGRNAKGAEKFKADDSLKVYADFFKQPHTLRSSNEDYAAGATTDVEAQEEDQKNGRKIKAPLFLLYSKDYIGSGFDVPKEWKDWVDEGVEIESHALGDGIGHFGAEEAPEESARVIIAWLKARGFKT